MIVFYPNRVTATRFQQTSRRKSPWLLNETGIRRGGKLPRGLQREPHSSWGRGIPRMAARATRQTREKIFRRSIEPLIRAAYRHGERSAAIISEGFFREPIFPTPPRCIDRSIHTRGQSASLKLHRLTNPRQPPCPSIHPSFIFTIDAGTDENRIKFPTLFSPVEIVNSISLQSCARVETTFSIRHKGDIPRFLFFPFSEERNACCYAHSPFLSERMEREWKLSEIR